MDIYQSTKKVAKEYGISLSQLALDAGLTRNAIYNWKNVTPQARSIKAVADVLNVTPQYLKGETDFPYPTASNVETNDSITQIVDFNYLNNYDIRYKGQRLSETDIQLIDSVLTPLLDRLTDK